MLSKREKKEFIDDGLNDNRKLQFRKLRRFQEKSALSPAEYLKFLNKVKNFFSSVTLIHKDPT